MDRRELEDTLAAVDHQLSAPCDVVVVGGAAKASLLYAGEGMAQPVDLLFQEWQGLGGAVLVAEVDENVPRRPAEDVVAESTAYCRESGRLTWVVLDWLLRHVEAVDAPKLLERTRQCGDLSVLGVLCDPAYQRTPDSKFLWLMKQCRPHPELTIFFHRVARSPLASQLTRENALDVFRRWNYLCQELRYL